MSEFTEKDVIIAWMAQQLMDLDGTDDELKNINKTINENKEIGSFLLLILKILGEKLVGKVNVEKLEVIV